MSSDGLGTPMAKAEMFDLSEIDLALFNIGSYSQRKKDEIKKLKFAAWLIRLRNVSFIIKLIFRLINKQCAFDYHNAKESTFIRCMVLI